MVKSGERQYYGTAASQKSLLDTGSATAAGSVNLVNVLDLESYVRGVVTNESPSSFHVEALKAQAVASPGRTSFRF